MTPGDLRRSSPAPGVLQLDLARPDVHNAISLGLQRELDAALADAAADPAVRVVVLAGEGPTAFSAGYDLKELRAMTPDAGTLSMLERDELLWRYFTFPKPTIAAVHGMAYGAGTLLAVCSDLRVGGPDTRITVTAAKYGGANLTWVLDTLIGAGQTRDLLMTSRAVSGAEAFRMGLVSRYAADGDVLGTALEAAEQIAAQPPESMREIKALLLEGPGQGLRSRYDRENTVSRTTLRPRPVEEMFSSYFESRVR
ncbi:enoyl-CoA hydratase/isomerase family protein [Rhodococcus oxybenzonivorans]|uniref:enoyl-CoA hydratase/isomerase family protein n=1 Tax=Rhodococcus oxybenzonivorans TaxID=1990687 RepID=UPI002954B983|nr:enoyl-CoA hydratase/isomerase family protein [Rhodococcus oxybenzonivorans]MDV7352851.1 enoyl-CoA hydratase/isomerase family protein [Rhodococcus oxybenzonivorans]